VAGKTELVVFSTQKLNFQPTFVLPKKPRKHYRQLDKLIHDLKNKNKSSYNPKPKILPRSYLIFLAISRYKKP
jgi:hypothetical protein